jgi:hypothetical protein
MGMDQMKPPFVVLPLFPVLEFVLAGINQNMFQHLFGIEFHYESHTHMRGIFPFKFALFFGFEDNPTYWLSHPSCRCVLDAAILSQTSAWIFDQVHTNIIVLRDSNCKIFSPD